MPQRKSAKKKQGDRRQATTKTPSNRRASKARRATKSKGKPNTQRDPWEHHGDLALIRERYKRLESRAMEGWPFYAFLVDVGKVRAECHADDITDDDVTKLLTMLNEAFQRSLDRAPILGDRIDAYLRWEGTVGRIGQRFCEAVLTLSDEQRSRCVGWPDEWAYTGLAALHLEKVRTTMQLVDLTPCDCLAWCIGQASDHCVIPPRGFECQNRFAPCWCFAYTHPTCTENVADYVSEDAHDSPWHDPQSWRIVPWLYRNPGGIEAAREALRVNRDGLCYNTAKGAYRAIQSDLCEAWTKQRPNAVEANPVGRWLIDPSAGVRREAELFLESVLWEQAKVALRPTADQSQEDKALDQPMEQPTQQTVGGTESNDDAAVARVDPTKPDARGYVASPSDASSYIPITEIQTEHCDDVGVTSIKQITTIVEEYSANRVRWTRPLTKKTGSPHPQRRNVHLADWRLYVQRMKHGPGRYAGNGFPDLPPSEIEARKDKVRRNRSGGK